MTKINITSDQLAEQAGNHTARAALEAMQKSPTQAARLEILFDAFIDIFSSSPGGEAALSGFVTGLLATLEKGLGLHK